MTHTPTEESRRQVKAMAGYGLGPDAICTILAITLQDLATHYAVECRQGPAEAEAKVRQALYQAAVSGKDPQAAKLWLEQNAGWY
jgi:hypothetical protein